MQRPSYRIIAANMTPGIAVGQQKSNAPAKVLTHMAVSESAALKINRRVVLLFMTLPSCPLEFSRALGMERLDAFAKIVGLPQS